MNTETPTITELKQEKPLVSLFVNLTTFELWQRPASLFTIPRWISFKLKAVFYLVLHMREALDFILIKRIFDNIPRPDFKESVKPRFLYLREIAISTFGEQALRDAATKLKKDPGLKFGEPSSGEVETSHNEGEGALVLLEVPERVLEACKPKPISLPTSPTDKAAFRVPIASPENVAACVKFLTGIIDEVRNSYQFNAPRLLALTEQMKEKGELSEKDLSTAMLLAAGPLAWIKIARPELALQINALEGVLEQATVMGAFGNLELSGAAFLGHWQKVLRDWQSQIDAMFGEEKEGEPC